MPIDLPTSPSEGQIVPPWIYSGGLWRRQFAPKVPKAARPRNLVVNPDMYQNNENTGAGITASNTYLADQWMYANSFTTSAYGERLAMRSLRNSAMRLRLGVFTVQAAQNNWGVRQPLEGFRCADLGWGTNRAVPAVLRFGLRAPAGTWALSLVANGDTACFVHPIVVTAGDANVDKEYTVPIPAPSVGTWNIDTALHILLRFYFACADSSKTAVLDQWQAGGFFGVTGMSHGLSSTANQFYLSDVGLYADPDDTGVAPPFEAPDPIDELYTCMRYWQTIGPHGFNWSGKTTNGAAYQQGCQFYTVMRAAPAMSGTNYTASGFPATPGTIAASTDGLREYRTANATTNVGFYFTIWEASARM